MTTKYYVEFVDKESDCNYIMQSKWLSSELECEKWLISEFDFIDFSVVDVYIMWADFDEDGDYGDIQSHRQITALNYLDIKRRLK